MESVATFPGAVWTSYDPWYHVTETPLLVTNLVEFQTTAHNVSDVGTTDRSNDTTTTLDIVALVLLPLVLLCGLVGNTLVCIAVFRFAPLRIVANYFIVSLAIADMAVCGIVMPLAAIQELAGEWPPWYNPLRCVGVARCPHEHASILESLRNRSRPLHGHPRPVWYALRRHS
eukprot:XP_011666150.1 PREDICTED: D(1A) dopamine receptor-like [Strongylocentrotus purpuratus]